MYYFVDNSIVILKAKDPFVDWINKVFSLDQPLSIDVVRQESNSYLIPKVEEIEDGINIVDDRFDELFALELSSWTEDKSSWPLGRSLQMFWEWFEVSVYPTLIEMDNESVVDVH
jgi:hypothetical protein